MASVLGASYGRVYPAIDSYTDITFDIQDINKAMKRVDFRWKILHAYSTLIVEYTATTSDFVIPKAAELLGIGMCELYNITYSKIRHLRLYDSGDFKLIITVSI